MPTPILVWITSKRHIAVGGVLLCDPKGSIALPVLPVYSHKSDTRFKQQDGVIENVLFAHQSSTVLTGNICKACAKKFERSIRRLK